MAELGRKGAETTAKRYAPDGLEADELPGLNTPADAERLLELVAVNVATGRLDHKRGDVVVRAVRAWLAAHDAGKVSDRLEELSSLVESLRDGGLKVA